MTDDLEVRFAKLVEHHVLHDAMPSIEDVAGDRPDLITPLRELAMRYMAVTQQLDDGAADSSGGAPSHTRAGSLPEVHGFKTIERLGAGGMGEVYKLQDLRLDRFVAAKVVRSDHALRTPLADFLGEARSMALFKDRRIVQIFEFRPDADPPVIIMEHVEGFELGRVGPSLEYTQRARILREVCEAIHHAHELGLQHRDLKPSNIMLDGSLSPKILDFGLAAGDPTSGHLKGTPAFLAPEQLDPSQPIDARTDVYALGVILYQLLCGTVPFGGRDTAEIIDAIRHAPPRLPIEIQPAVPEPLQAIALKAMERRPADRYESAHEMALDLTRYLEGRPVLARPTLYLSTLEARVTPHLTQIAEWLRLKLIYSHEADHLRSAYGRLRAREDDWIAASRALTYSQIALYFGAFLLLAGSLFYFNANLEDHVPGVWGPFFALGLPFIGLNVAGRYLYRTERRAVAIALFLGGVGLLPVLLLIWFHNTNVLAAPENAENQIFENGSPSNLQLQITIACAFAWAGWLAWRTRTAALSTVFTLLALLLTLAILGDFGLRSWINEPRLDLLALHIWPLAVIYAVLGMTFERAGRTWFVQPLYVGAALVCVGSLDLLALEGKTFHYLNISMKELPLFRKPPGDEVRLLVDTMTALSLNGVAFYALAWAITRGKSALAGVAATMLFIIAPFSTLEPIAYLIETASYSRRFDWLYLGLAVTAAVLSRHRQRKSFYYAGVLNSAFALYWVARDYEWLDRPAWAIGLVIAGLAALAVGFRLDAKERNA